jgi:hypothetical protein
MNTGATEVFLVSAGSADGIDIPAKIGLRLNRSFSVFVNGPATNAT